VATGPGAVPLIQARSANELDPLPELAKYEVLGEVGHGGMATVYRALDRRLGREVAVKIIHRHLRDNPEVATRFTAEARAVAKLRHPNIVEVYDVSDDQDRERYLVVELVRGTTLRKLLVERGHLPAEIAAAIGLAVADALHHAHQQGVIHRDVKPENVLVADPTVDDSERASNPESLVKITDFGIAKILDAQGVTSTGQVLGSPAHMSPEQIEGGDVSSRSDVFGLGVLLYECMVGELPFDGRNPAQVLRRVLDGTYLPADRARDTVGFRFSRILDRALAHGPVDRHESAAELGNELSAELGRLGFTEPYRELDDYLRNPASYLETYSARMVERLAALGREAQAAGDVVEAAHQFNRALAFRPDDPELIRLVSGLTRAQKLRAAARRLGIGAAAAAVVGLGTYGAASVYYAQTHAHQPASQTQLKATAELPQVTAKAEPVPSSSASQAPALPRPLARPPPKAEQPEKTLRTVQVLIPGASAGKVTIDGETVGIHGAKKDLVVGQTYLFEFIPPNEDCCVGSKKRLVIPAGEGTFQVSGSITLRPATIQASGAPPGSSISCVHWGPAPSPPLVVKLSDPEQASDSCTVSPPTSTGILPRTQNVKIRPGQTIDLWP
jgi:tRNA A-37 threonylcarbamoyl transferase component Bud32